jgi:branched-chain amino acid transport system ATP-binding protein
VTAPLLEVASLVTRYGGVVALHGVSLDVGESEAVAVLGPNGAGKTTLLRTISGLVRPAAGAVRLGTHAVTRWSAHRITRAGFVHVPEGRAMLAPLTVEENLQLGGHNLPRGEAAAEKERILDLFPVLRARLHARSGVLSGGEQQMLAIARGLMARPRVLAIDEPSMGLAPVMVEAVLEGLRRVITEGTALLLAEQNARLALDVADRAYVLVHGEIVRSGRSDELGDDVIDTYLT